MRHNQLFNRVIMPLFYVSILCANNLMQSSQTTAIPCPSWLIKSPLPCKPSSDWWKDETAHCFDEKEIVEKSGQGNFSLMDLASLNHGIENLEPINNSAKISVITPDPWVPWETDVRYLQSTPCLKNAAFCIASSWQPLNNNMQSLRSENPTIGIHRNAAVCKSQLVTHLFAPQIAELLQTPNLSQEELIQKMSVIFETIIKASIYARSPELVLPMDCAPLMLVVAALKQKNIIDTIKQYGVHLTLVYTPDHKNRPVKLECTAFIELLEMVDSINHTKYYHDRPVHLFIFSYFSALHAYEQEKENNEIKPETEKGFHHLANQMRILLKKFIVGSCTTPKNHYNPDRPIVIISIPKAGNNMVGEAISLLTGKSIMWPGDAFGPVLDAAIKDMDKDRFIYVHLAHRPSDIEVIKKHNPILFFIYRDPRDLAVSTADYRQHWFQLDGKQHNDFAPLLTDVIATFVSPWYADATKLRGIAGLYDAIMPWINYPGICAIRFEDIIGEKGGGSAAKQRETIERIAKHLGISYDNELIDYVIQNIYGNGLTFRKGKIGSWKQHFSQTDIELFKQSMGQWLIDWGYEKDLNW